MLLARLVARDGGNGRGAHQGAAVHLPELLRVELLDQLLERGADQVFTLCREHAHVLVGRFEVHNVRHRHQVDLCAVAGLDHVQPRCGGGRRGGGCSAYAGCAQ